MNGIRVRPGKERSLPRRNLWRCRTLVTLVLVTLGGCVSPTALSDVGDAVAFDAAVTRLMAGEHVVGLALALIDDGRVARVATYGWRNEKMREPITADTVMAGASLTKAVFAQLVLQLVDEGRLELDAPLARLLPRPLPEYPRYAELQGDERWRLLTARHVLAHSTGFANFRWLEPDRRLRLHFDPGSRYAYSGEGFGLLQFAIENGLGIDVAQAMQERVFARLGMTRTSMRWRSDFDGDAADTYDAGGSVTLHARRLRADAAGSMDTSIADQARFWAAALRGEGISAGARRDWARSQLPIRSAHQFPTLAAQDAGNERRGLSAGLGVVVFGAGDGAGWFKGGHDDGTANMAICLEHRRRCVVILANDVRAERIYPQIAHLALGPTAMPWSWEYAWLAPSARFGPRP